MPPEIDLLTQMIEEISGELALQPLLERIVERACRLIGANDGLIGLYDPERDVVRVAVTYRIPPEQIRIGSETARGEGLMGLVLERGAPVHCRYGDLPAPINPAAFANDVIGMPIRAEGRLIGVFSICSVPPDDMVADAEQRLEQFARHAAVAIVNANRYSEEQRRAARFALIARVAAMSASGPDLDSLLQQTADAIHDVLRYPAIDIPLLDPHDPDTLIIRVRGGEYKRRIRIEDRMPVAKGVMGAAVRERRIQKVNDVSVDPRYVLPPGVEAPRAELAIPILHGGAVLGVLNVESDRPFDDLDCASLEIVAEHLAMSIVNARLFERSKYYAVIDERQRLARDLHDNVTQLLSSINLLSQSLAETWRRDPASGEKRILRLAELSRMALVEMRALLQQLTPDDPSEATRAEELSVAMTIKYDGLKAALHRLMAVFVPIGQALSLDLENYLPQKETQEQALLMVCQEAVSNAIRHAHAVHIKVAAYVTDAHAVLQIVDDGVGIPADAALGMGLAGMSRRLEELGGKLEIVATPPRTDRSGETRIIASLPRRDRDAS
jgi:two-component system, NarL family, sensor kinase